MTVQPDPSGRRGPPAPASRRRRRRSLILLAVLTLAVVGTGAPGVRRLLADVPAPGCAPPWPAPGAERVDTGGGSATPLALLATGFALGVLSAAGAGWWRRQAATDAAPVAEAALRESEERFRLAFDNANTGMCLVGLDGRLLQVNDKLGAMFGYSRTELETMTVTDLAVLEDLDLSLNQIQYALQGEGDSLTFEKRYRHRDGRIMHGMVASSLVRDARGRPRYFISQVQDVSAQRESERQLRLSEERHRLIADNAIDTIWTMGLNLRFTYLGPSVLKLRGFTPEEQMAQSLDELFAPGSLPVAMAYLERFRASVRDGLPVENFFGELELCCKDGSTVWTEITASPLYDSAGRILELVGVTRDISERRRMQERLRISEERHRLLADNALDVIWSCDHAGRFLFIGPRVERLRGFTVAQAMQQSLAEVLAPESFATALEYLRGVAARLQAGQPPENFRGELEQRCRDGSTIWTEVIACPVLAADGTLVEILGATRDISERKEYECHLKAAQDAAEQANAAKSQFLAHMSHEIRTPLNVVLGFAQVLGQESLTANQRDMVERIRTAGRSLLGILNDVLDLSKIEAGQLRIEARAFDPQALLERLAELLGQAAGSKGLTLRIAALSPSPGPLMGDALRLEQVLVNLVGNAIKFTRQGEVAVSCTVGSAHAQPAAESLWLHWTVRDTGIGIDRADQARLFAPFAQVEAGISRRFGGTGLGLSISKRLVELMGGRIGVASAPGRGSTFWFEVPCARAAGTVPATVATPPPLRPGPRLAGRHVLVVDDSAMNRDLVEQALALEGASVTLAPDGAVALRYLRERPAGFDAVLMDVQMPVLDGLGATRAIRGELGLADLPVIALTAGVLGDQRAEASAAGIDDLLPKPLDLEQMTTLLLHWVGARPGTGTVAAGSPPGPGPGPGGEDGEFPPLPGIDHECALRALGGNRGLFLRLLRGFADEFAQAAGQVRRDLDAGERTQAARRLHTLRGNAGTLGARDLAAAAGALEERVLGGETDLGAALAALAEGLTALVGAARDLPGALPVETPPSLAAGRVAALRAALEGRELSALGTYEVLRPALAAALGEAHAAALDQAVRGLRFAEARALLDALPGSGPVSGLTTGA